MARDDLLDRQLASAGDLDAFGEPSRVVGSYAGEGHAGQHQPFDGRTGNVGMDRRVRRTGGRHPDQIECLRIQICPHWHRSAGDRPIRRRHQTGGKPGLQRGQIGEDPTCNLDVVRQHPDVHSIGCVGRVRDDVAEVGQRGESSVSSTSQPGSFRLALADFAGSLDWENGVDIRIQVGPDRCHDGPSTGEDERGGIACGPCSRKGRLESIGEVASLPTEAPRSAAHRSARRASRRRRPGTPTI